MEKTENKDLYQRLMRAADEYLNKIDEYNERRIWKVGKKLKYTAEVAHALGLDAAVVSGIVIGEELTRTAYGELGERFVREKAGDFSHMDLAMRMMIGILEGTDPERVAAILEGMEHLEGRKDATAEEKLAFMLIDGHYYAQGLDTESKQDICFINYKERIMQYSKREKQLIGPKIPVLEHPRPRKRKVKEERAWRAMETVHGMYKEGKLQLPEHFDRAFGDMDEDARYAYFIVAHPEKVIEKRSGLGVFSKDDDDYLTFDDLE